MRLPLILALFAGTLVAACNPTPQQRYAAQCGATTLTGAVLGAAAGNQLGGGSGRAISTAAGGGMGAMAGSSLGC